MFVTPYWGGDGFQKSIGWSRFPADSRLQPEIGWLVTPPPLMYLQLRGSGAGDGSAPAELHEPASHPCPQPAEPAQEGKRSRIPRGLQEIGWSLTPPLMYLQLRGSGAGDGSAPAEHLRAPSSEPQSAEAADERMTIPKCHWTLVANTLRGGVDSRNRLVGRWIQNISGPAEKLVGW